jgi:hypothetical protein
MKHLLIPSAQYNSIVDLIQPGIYGIINNRNVFIGYSNNILQSVSSQLAMIQSGTHTYIKDPIDQLQIVIIETNPISLKISQTYWADYYKTQGYQVLNNKRLLRYKIRTRVDNNFQVIVELVSKRNNAKVVGVFAKVSEAEAYCKLLQQNDPIVPIVCTNDLTSKYLKEYGKTKF